MVGSNRLDSLCDFRLCILDDMTFVKDTIIEMDMLEDDKIISKNVVGRNDDVVEVDV